MTHRLACMLVFWTAVVTSGWSTNLLAASLDWVNWRGPQYSGVGFETGLPDDWDPKGGEGSNLKWKKEGFGSRSTPIIMNGKIYYLARSEPETEREGERVVCLNAETGDLLWENKFNVWLSDVPDTRVGWSSVVGDPETGNVYALGVCGFFQCLNGETGKTIWSVPLHERFGFLSTYGGRTNFPVICDDIVVVSAVIIGWGDMAKPSHRFLGFDKRTGEVAWFQSTRLLPDDTTYSSPAVAVLNGQKVFVLGCGDGMIWAMQPRTGKIVWRYQLSIRGVNAPPLIVGDTVFASHSEENISGTAMGALASIKGNLTGDVTKAGENWKIEEVMVGRAAPLLIDGRLYCFDDSAKLRVFNAQDGEEIGRRQTLGTMMRASPLYADGKIYAVEANGRWFIYEPDPDQGARVLSKGRLGATEECHAAPICWNGKVYIMTTEALYCLEDPTKEHGSVAPPELPQETPVSEDLKPVQLQIIPAELLIRPGKTQKFRLRWFNAKGQVLDELAKLEGATFSVDGVGEVSADGTYTAPADGAHVSSFVTAKVGDLSAQCRIRIVPPLPWKFDFEGMKDLPVTWVGARYRHVIRNVDGNNVAVKITTIPKGTRSRAWFGQSDLHDYTIQAEVRGAIANNKMPDIGLLAHGYTLDMQGEAQKLQIRSWDPQLRMQQTVDFKWEPNKWYILKLQASNEGSQCILRGKVWPRGEAEPEAWTVVATDENPIQSGSPGLYGNATGAEIWLDNIEVYAN